MFQYVIDMAGLLPATVSSLNWQSATGLNALAGTFTVSANPQTTASAAARAINGGSTSLTGTITASAVGRFLIVSMNLSPSVLTGAGFAVTGDSIVQPALAFGDINVTPPPGLGSTSTTPSSSTTSSSSSASVLLAGGLGAVAGYLLAKD